MDALLDTAGRAADADTADRPGAHRRALVVRHRIEALAAEVQDRFARALGPRPLVGDAEVVERFAALTVYRRQCHVERDLEVLGRTVDPPAGR